MSRFRTRLKRWIVPMCLMLCAAALAGGIFAITASSREIATSLSGVDGDNAGIRKLRIWGEIEDTDAGFSYIFAREGENDGPVRFDPWNRSIRTPYVHWPFVDETSVMFRPVSGVREMIIPEEQDETEYYTGYDPVRKRVYADVFEAVPMLPTMSGVAVRLDPGAEKLYYAGGPDTYLELFSERDADIAQYPYETLNEVRRWAAIPSYIAMGNRMYFVPALEGLYGRTAVYAFDTSLGDIDLGLDDDYPAREVLPIWLSKGVDEICGFLTCSDALFLAVRHGGEIELTRIVPEDGEFPSVRIPANLDLEQPLTKDALMLFASRTAAGQDVDYCVLDTSTMQIVASGMNVRIGGGHKNVNYISGFELRAFCLADGALYVGSEAMVPRIPEYDYRQRLYITALDPFGVRLGCAEVMVGLCDDPNLPYDAANQYFFHSRRLTALELSEGGFYD